MVSPPRVYAFPLATFHVCVLVLVFVALAYPGMGGVDELNTALGLAIFGLLWAASFYGTAWALDDVRIHAIDVAFRRGIGGGARSGVIVALAGVLPAALLGSDGSVAGVLGIALIYGALATLAAALVGGAIGFVFSLLDWAILTIAGLGDGWHPERLRREDVDG